MVIIITNLAVMSEYYSETGSLLIWVKSSFRLILSNSFLPKILYHLTLNYKIIYFEI